MRASIAAILVLTVLLAGCMGGPAADDGNVSDGAMDGNETDDTDDDATEDDGTMSTDDGSGTFELLISDRKNAIGDFDSLTVSFSHARIFSGGDGEDDDGNATEDEMETDGNETDAEGDDAESHGNETDGASGEDDTADEGDDGQGGFETLELDDASVDLTTVVGDNATAIGAVELAPGTYNKVELHVASVDGVVDNESVDVKVPSEKLMITKRFTVEANATTSFVFDIQVVEKGGGQGYNLLPVISESGVAGEDVDVERTDEKDGDEATGDTEAGEDDGHSDDDEHDDGDEQDNDDEHEGDNATESGAAMNATA